MSRIPAKPPPQAPQAPAAPPRREAEPQLEVSAPSTGWAAGTRRAAAPAATGAAGEAAALTTAAALFQGLAARDPAAMARCYDPQVQFHDPLFGALRGAGQTMDMWKTIMPAANPATFKVEPKVQPNPTQNADGSFTVKVHWDAHYDLGKRHVDNHADSTLQIKDGKIVSQRDDWDLAAWTKQALPFGGGTRVLDDLTRLAAHSFIELKSLFEAMK